MSDDAIPAATLVTMRPARAAGSAPDLLVVRRTRRMAFAAGMIVFPGGRIDAEDRRMAEKLGAGDKAAHLTAIRETLEETGVAVALGDISPERARQWQQALLDGEAFTDLLGREGVTPDLSALTPFARWMPAFKQPRKFDTLFLLAEAPPGDWQPTPQPGECDYAGWSSATELLAQIEAGEEGAIFPTKRNLERLARYHSYHEAADDAGRHSLDTIVPWIETRDGEAHVVIPADRGYPVTAEPLRTAFRA